jgi:hypothetical protein
LRRQASVDLISKLCHKDWDYLMAAMTSRPGEMMSPADWRKRRVEAAIAAKAAKRAAKAAERAARTAAKSVPETIVVKAA